MNKLIKWLLEGDVTVQYLTYRDLLGKERTDLYDRTNQEGFGKRLLDHCKEDGHWGGGYYRQKWISTHYTLMTFRRLNVKPETKITRAINLILHDYYHEKTEDCPKPWRLNDICMNGMLLYVFAFYKVEEPRLKIMIDYILTQQMPDGGYNCQYNYKHYKPHHSSLHSTLSLVEGLTEYINQGYTYRIDEVKKQREDAIEFILMHRLYKSDHTGEIINQRFLRLSFPPRWFYDILKALDAFREADIPYDERMEDAIESIMAKRRKDGTWPVQQKYSGQVYFDLEKTGSSSRINTLRVLRVLKHFKPEVYDEIMNE